MQHFTFDAFCAMTLDTAIGLDRDPLTFVAFQKPSLRLDMSGWAPKSDSRPRTKSGQGVTTVFFNLCLLYAAQTQQKSLFARLAQRYGVTFLR